MFFVDYPPCFFVVLKDTRKEHYHFRGSPKKTQFFLVAKLVAKWVAALLGHPSVVRLDPDPPSSYPVFQWYPVLSLFCGFPQTPRKDSKQVSFPSQVFVASFNIRACSQSGEPKVPNGLAYVGLVSFQDLPRRKKQNTKKRTCLPQWASERANPAGSRRASRGDPEGQPGHRLGPGAQGEEKGRVKT